MMEMDRNERENQRPESLRIATKMSNFESIEMALESSSLSIPTVKQSQVCVIALKFIIRPGHLCGPFIGQ